MAGNFLRSPSTFSLTAGSLKLISEFAGFTDCCGDLSWSRAQVWALNLQAERAEGNKTYRFHTLCCRALYSPKVALIAGSPTRTRNVSSIALRLPKETMLVDCGEATARQIVVAGIEPASITNIFITHLHGDHCFGLMGIVEHISKARRATRSTVCHTFLQSLHLLSRLKGSAVIWMLELSWTLSDKTCLAANLPSNYSCQRQKDIENLTSCMNVLSI